MTIGTICKLVPLTSQSHLENAEVVPDHNDHGYGQIAVGDNQVVYFSHGAVEGCRFEELWVGQQVEFEIDSRQREAAAWVRLVNADPALGSEGVRMPPASEGA